MVAFFGGSCGVAYFVGRVYPTYTCCWYCAHRVSDFDIRYIVGTWCCEDSGIVYWLMVAFFGGSCGVVYFVGRVYPTYICYWYCSRGFSDFDIGYIMGKFGWGYSLVAFFCCLRQLNIAEFVSKW